MNYWLDLFTGTTWREFLQAGANISGFREKQRKITKRVQPGDVFVCYLTGVMRWVGALEVIKPTNDNRPIWSDNFPVRFEVKPLVVLQPEHGVPMDQLEGKVDFFRGPQHRGKFNGFVRMSPNLFRQAKDGELILSLLRTAEREPVARPVDPKKLARKPLFKADRTKGKTKVSTVVSVPEPDDSEAETSAPTTRHTEIQYQLLKLGAEMGFDVWVARNDRARKWNSAALGALPRMVGELPTQFNEATNRTIELIDVLWLKGNSIVAAFEVECTTAIYSGLLRMSDLLALQPNLEINLFLVAPDERREKVEQEILRPTFALREKPLARVCGFIGFSTLMEKLDGIRELGLATSLKPDFLQNTAEYFAEDDEM
jgi:hypothetical protein